MFVVFDLSDMGTLEHATQWMEEACQSADKPIKCLVGTKKDLISPTTYKDVETRALAIANQLGAEFWALSSKTGIELFNHFSHLWQIQSVVYYLMFNICYIFYQGLQDCTYF